MFSHSHSEREGGGAKKTGPKLMFRRRWLQSHPLLLYTDPLLGPSSQHRHRQNVLLTRFITGVEFGFPSVSFLPMMAIEELPFGSWMRQTRICQDTSSALY